jgi:hypothetical protein
MAEASNRDDATNDTATKDANDTATKDANDTATKDANDTATKDANDTGAADGADVDAYTDARDRADDADARSCRVGAPCDVTHPCCPEWECGLSGFCIGVGPQ